jgi:hypothetical protein
VAHLRLASAEDAKPDAAWLQSVDELSAALKANGEGVFAVVMTRDGGMEIFASGDVPCDAVAGFAARVLASMANEG